MGESKHTPGEWYEEDRGERIVILAEGYDREILSVDTAEGEPEEETQRANATIARAAPLMLEALRALRTRGVEHEGEDCWCPSSRHVASRGHATECVMTCAAIKAATGGEP